MQSRLASLLEAKANTFIGLGINYAAGFVIYPLFGHSFEWDQLVGITAAFTILSIGRGYVVRRVFNHYGNRGRAGCED